MENKKNIDEFFTLNSLKTLGGSSSAVWVTTNVISYVFGYNQNDVKWVGLVVAIILTISVCISQKKLKIQYYVIALLNGMLIYSTSVGISSIAHGSLKNVDTTKALQSNIIPSSMNQASFILFGEAWWQPRELVDQVDNLSKERKVLLVERDSLIKVNKKLVEEINNTPDNLKEYNNKIDSLNKELKSLAAKNDDFKKEIDGLINNKPDVSIKIQQDKINKLEADIKILNNKISGLQRENESLSSKLKECNDKKNSMNCDDYIEKNKSLQNELNKCNDQLKKINADRDKDLSKIRELTNKLQECKDQKVDVDCVKLKVEYAAKLIELSNLQRKYDQLKSECDKYKGIESPK